MLKKRSYLSERALKFYLGSTILATMSTSLGVVVDGVIVGQLLGVDALTAVSLCAPLLQFLATFMLLLNSGNALMLSMAIGRGKMQNVKAHFSFAVGLNMLLGVILVLAGLFFSDEISRMLCTEEELLPMVEGYARVVLLSAPVYLLLPALGLFVRADGAPGRTTMALLVANVLNLMFDIVFIKWLDLGVAGSSLATTSGYLVGLGFFVHYLITADTDLKFVKSLKSINKTKALMLALPIAMASALMTVRIFGVNRIIGDNLGASGLGQMAVCFNLLMLVSMFVAGVSQSIQPVAGFMIGKGDLRGFGFVSTKALKILVSIVGSAVLLFELFPRQILEILGYTDEALICEAMGVVRIVSVSFIFYGVNYLLMVVHQLSGRTVLSMFISVMQPIIVLPVMLLLVKLDVEMAWWSFLVGELLVLLSCIGYSVVVKLKYRRFHPVILMPIEQQTKSLEVSISSATDDDFRQLTTELNAFLEAEQVDSKLKYHIELCCDELLTNILRYAYKNSAKRYIDISVVLKDGGASLSIKDDGVSFDPVKHKDSENIGLLIVKGICKKIDYVRNSGQNMTFVEL